MLHRMVQKGTKRAPQQTQVQGSRTVASKVEHWKARDSGTRWDNGAREGASWVTNGKSVPKNSDRFLTPQNQHLFKVLVDCEQLRHTDTPAWAYRALDLFKINGFVVLENACAREIWEPLHAACRVAEKHCRRLNKRGNRDFGRWSFGLAFGSKLDDPAWQAMLRVPSLSIFLPLLFPNGGDCVSAGGDFVIPQHSDYQQLHSDIAIKREFNVPFPCPFMCINFAVQECTVRNGAIRILPGTHVGNNYHPKVANESQESKMSRALMAPGDILVRDVRTIHGGTPNVEEDPSLSRYLPSLEFTSREFRRSGRKDIWDDACLRLVPQQVVDTLPEAMKPFMNEVVIQEASSSTAPSRTKWNSNSASSYGNSASSYGNSAVNWQHGSVHSLQDGEYSRYPANATAEQYGSWDDSSWTNGAVGGWEQGWWRSKEQWWKTNSTSSNWYLW